MHPRQSAASRTLPDLLHRGEPASDFWTYTTETGEELLHVARFDGPYGKITILPWTWGGAGWEQRFPAPLWPLYGLELLAAMPNAPVTIVESERAADALREWLGSGPVVSWLGGPRGVPHVDWSPLAGRQVTIWMPPSPTSTEAANDIVAELEVVGALAARISVRAQEGGWDPESRVRRHA